MLPLAAQLLKEFIGPLVFSIAWVLFNVYSVDRADSWTVQRVVNVFGPTFFLISWLFGQIFRVRKQLRIEHTLAAVEKRLLKVLEDLDVKTKSISDHVTGGDSFVYLWPQTIPLAGANRSLHFMATVRGASAVYNARAQISDVNDRRAHYEPLVLGDRTPGVVNYVSISNPRPTAEEHVLQVFITARNGSFRQLIHLKKIGDYWSYAIRVTNGAGNLLFEEVSPEFPREENGEIAWKE